MDPFKRIQILLRLAELCSPTEAERRQGYMNQVEIILNGIESQKIDTPITQLIDLMNFDAQPCDWDWWHVSELFNSHLTDILPVSTPQQLGHVLAGVAKFNPLIRRKRTNTGTAYYMPPFKEIKRQ